jgi:hypothetical protein
MERIVALVEGHTEAHFIEATYANAIVQRPFPNGKDVAIDVIVESIVDALETVGGSIKKVVVLLDRERREASAAEIAGRIISELTHKCPSRKIYVGVSDRQIENWILADEIYIRRRFNTEFRYAGDGFPAKAVLEDLCGRVLKGPRDKANMLKECSALRGSERSESLRMFRNLIDFDWSWATN